VDTSEAVGEALAAKAAGAGQRAVANLVGRPRETVRNWLRRFGARAAELRAHFVSWALALDDGSVYGVLELWVEMAHRGARAGGAPMAVVGIKGVRRASTAPSPGACHIRPWRRPIVSLAEHCPTQTTGWSPSPAPQSSGHTSLARWEASQRRTRTIIESP
jgi:hypothetical protein